jgi:hypothetical protein
VKGFFKYALQTSREVTARSINISAIDHIVRGQQTKRFALARVVALSNEGDTVMRLMLDSEAISLSVVYRATGEPPVASGIPMIDGSLVPKPSMDHRFATLDLILPNQQTYDTLLKALEELVTLHREETKRYARNILFLQLHWTDLGKEFSDNLSSSEWLILGERMNIPTTKADHLRLFKNYEKQLHEGEGMLFSYVGEILEDIEAEIANDPCDRLWSEIVATDPIPAVKLGRADDDASMELFNDEEEEETISAVAFLSFIRSQQKEFSTSLEDVVKLVHILNNQISWDDMGGNQRFDVTEDTKIASLDRLGKSRFINFLMSDANDLFDPSAGLAGADDMTKPLSHYWINTSHDTYLARSPGGYFKRAMCTDIGNGIHTTQDAIDEQMYLFTLQRGIRCIDLDIWDGVSGEPVVSRIKPTGTDKTIPLAVVLRIVRSFLKSNPSSFPVILRLENHCTFLVQQKVAQQINNILVSANILAFPEASETMNGQSSLPCPESMKGKVLIMGKRPTVVEEGAKVLNDDFDDENDGTHDNLSRDIAYDEEKSDEMDQHIVGFTSSGPISATAAGQSHKEVQSLDDILNEAIEAADSAKQAAALAEARAARLQFEAAEGEKLAAQLTQEAGLSPADVKNRAAASGNGCDHGVEVQLGTNGFGRQDEGLEVQEFLHDEIKGSRNRYSSVIAEAIEASEIATLRLTELNDAEAALKLAETNLYQARQREKDLAEKSRRAAVEARCSREHAESAKRRVGTVRDLLRKCEESANSAKTVVVTATTEAKISERRAAEAEARASRALAGAERDRARADDETKKEEQLEQEASKLHVERSEAINVAKLARERVEKAAAMLERVDEQIKLIEGSDQFQKEVQQNPDYRGKALSPSHADPGSFLAKHAAKVEEMKLCKDLIKEASSENSKAEALRRSTHEKFEEKAQMWKIQADIAAQVRKQADRSSMVAEELAEHAEEERDAATLRHVAREKAELNVQQRNSHLESVRAQLTEAERAASEAADLAVENRKRADRLCAEAEAATDYTEKIRSVENCKLSRDQAAADYEAARVIKEEKDAIAADTKRLLETNAEVYTSAVRDAAAESHRVNSERLLEKKAVLAFNRALLTRKQADHAKALSKIAMATSQEKAQAARRAQEYKDRSSKISVIPVALAKQTWFHTTRHRYWEKSLSLPSSHVLSMAHQAVALSHSKDPKSSRRKMLSFTKSHLCRTFPSKLHLKHTQASNNDPVLPWSMGCQLVAMNFHTPDEHLLVAEARFRQNGSCGYVLKPLDLTEGSTKSLKEQRWKIRVLRGSYLPKPDFRHAVQTGCVSPFIKMTLYDGNSTSKETQHVTAAVSCNGLNPVWDETAGFEFVVLRPSVAMVTIAVWDRADHGVESFIAGAAFPVAHLRQGYRSVALFDSSHTRSGPFALASLLVNCQKVYSEQ